MDSKTNSGEVARSLGYLSAIGRPGSGAVSAQGLHIWPLHRLMSLSGWSARPALYTLSIKGTP